MNKKEKKSPEIKGFSLKTWAKIWPFLRPHSKHLVFTGLTMLIMSVCDLAIPLFLSTAVDKFVVPGITDGLLMFIGIYLAVIILQSLSVYVMGRNSMAMDFNLGRDLKHGVFVHLQKLGLSYYNQNAVGWIMARTMSDPNRITDALAWAMIDIFWGAFYIIGVLIIMFILNWQMALLVTIIVPVVSIVVAIFQKKFYSAHKDVRAANTRITGAYNEGITGAKTSKTLVIEEQNGEEFREITGYMRLRSLYAARLNALFVPILTFFSAFAVAMVLARGGILVLDGVIEFGMLSAFVSYALSILEPIQQFARAFSELISTQVNIQRIDDLLNTPCSIEDTEEVNEKYGDCFNPKTENWEKIKGDIEFKNVWFKYPDGEDWILEDFSLKIPAGTNIALVGETGAGKSTLVNIACRFFEPTKGTVLIDGVDYKERSQLWLHSQLGYVLQNPHLFSGTVKENIRYGKLDATDEEIYSAAKLVSANNVVEKLEDGYSTDVGEGGDRLSTGEKQLISFARAVVANPPIFVLDEATSSIDTETEQLIQNAISHVLSGRTSFLVAHRLSTIRHADLILVVKEGRIIERGTHDELMTQNEGYYHGLYTAMRISEASEKTD